MLRYTRAYEGDDPYIFVSYAHKDSEKVLPIICELYERKYRVWYDEGIAPGSEWPRNIAMHLQNASVVIFFVSENSLSSPNCENEVLLATNQRKKTIQICLNGTSKHTLLCQDKTLEYNDALINKLSSIEYLDDDLVGDGINGYQYSIEKKRSINTWNLMLGLAAMMAIVLSTTLFGLYNGWFDDLLPAKQPVIEIVAPTSEPQEVISIDSNILGSVLPVVFSSDEEKNAVYQKLGWTQSYEMTYKDLSEMDWISHIEIFEDPIYDITFAKYLPNLEMITLSSSLINDLSALIECPRLKVVQVTADMLPITIPEPRIFKIEVT